MLRHSKKIRPPYLLFYNQVRSERTSTTDVDSQLQEVISSLETYLISSIVEEEDDDAKKKVAFLLLQIVEQFAYKINFEKCNPEKVNKMNNSNL